MFEEHSAIADSCKPEGRDGADGRRRLRIGEIRGWTLVQVAAFPTTRALFANALHQTLNMPLPTQIGTSQVANGVCVMKAGEQQYWLVTAKGVEPTYQLLAAVPPDIGAVTPLSDSRTCLFIDGPAAREVLARGISLDLDPHAFPIQQFRLTGLHHTPVLLLRSGEEYYKLYVMRTFARSIWDWITDAALQFGYDIVNVEPAESPVL